MLTVATFRWKPPTGYRSVFGPETVIVLRDMIRRNYAQPHRFVCVTDDPAGLKDVETIPLWDDFASVPSPHGRGNPSCYRRLKLFDPTIASLLGPRIVSMDLDTVIVGDLAPIFNRTEDFVIWGQADQAKQWYNGSLFMLTAGARPRVWSEFNPKTSPLLAKRAGKFGSDQGWISYCLGPKEATFGQQDGVYSFRVHVQPKGDDYLPENARIINFHGHVDPWHWRAQRLDWVRKHYGVAA